MDTTGLAQAIDFAFAAEVETDSEEEELTQDMTIVEFTAQYKTPLPRLTRLSNFLFIPYHPDPLAVKIHRYFQEVRQRIIESHRYDKTHYANTVYQAFCRWMGRVLAHMKRNLAK